MTHQLRAFLRECKASSYKWPNGFNSAIFEASSMLKRNRKLEQAICDIDDTIINYYIQCIDNMDRLFVSIGSTPEGISLASSDRDVMFLSLKLAATERNVHRSEKGILQIEYTTKPGYVRLRVPLATARSYGMIPGHVHVEKRRLYLKNDAWKEGILNNEENPDISEVHGPALTNETGLQDTVHGIHCAQWPSCAKGFQRRKRAISKWPSSKVMRSIMQKGCCLVPVGHPMHHQENQLWRVSFNMAEQELLRSFNDTQVFCCFMLKMVLRYHFPEETVLCSYWCKTVMLWLVQNTERRCWIRKHFIRNLHKALYLLHRFMEHHYLPMFFLPENNLISHKDRHACLRVAKSLEDMLHVSTFVRAVLDCLTYSTISGVTTDECPNNSNGVSFQVDESQNQTNVKSFLDFMQLHWQKDHILPHRHCGVAEEAQLLATFLEVYEEDNPRAIEYTQSMIRESDDDFLKKFDVLLQHKLAKSMLFDYHTTRLSMQKTEELLESSRVITYPAHRLLLWETVEQQKNKGSQLMGIQLIKPIMLILCLKVLYQPQSIHFQCRQVSCV
ncbi:cyclic GMP-AMP synthase-like receptor 2 isoform X2 [Antedon mediterranea]|uniref:cyclic GMP-AMP synthase-like receptor 2 isoform X2 n=1 Tax=Antedon mediterranea TaxID=105859 RepID=UPI003AF9E590